MFEEDPQWVIYIHIESHIIFSPGHFSLTSIILLAGIEAESIMRSGGLVSDSIMVKLIVGELSKKGWIETRPTHTAGLSFGSDKHSSDSPSASFLLDGFPRTQGQAQKLDEEVSMNFVSWTACRNLQISRHYTNRSSGRQLRCSARPHRRPGRKSLCSMCLMSNYLATPLIYIANIS